MGRDLFKGQQRSGRGFENGAGGCHGLLDFTQFAAQLGGLGHQAGAFVSGITEHHTEGDHADQGEDFQQSEPSFSGVLVHGYYWLLTTSSVGSPSGKMSPMRLSFFSRIQMSRLFCMELKTLG